MSVRPHLKALARDERGVGLIELLTVLAVLGTVVGMAVTLFVSAMASEADLSERVRAQEQARLALEKLRKEVHQACSVSPAGPTSSVTLTMPASLATGSPLTFCTGATSQVTWCTRAVTGVAQRHTLHRVAGSTCGTSGGVRWADFLTVANVFEYVAETPSTLATLGVTLSVDLKPADASRAYRLKDALALRNSQRR